jgi:LPS sulfotransferase NodH
VKGSTVDLQARDIRPLTAEEVEEARAFFPMPKFFIFGHARSGTTLLARLIRVHSEVHCNWQAHFFTRPPLLYSLVEHPDVAEWLSRRSNRWNRGQDLSPVVLRAVGDFILEREARRMGKTIVGDKSPNSLLHGEAVRLMHQLYPDGKLIFIVRDGRDAAVSHRFQTFIDATRHLTKEDWKIREAFERTPEPFLRGECSIFTEEGIRRAARGWVRNVTETDEQARELFGTQYYSLRYEDLLEDPWNQMCRVWDFLGADTALEGLQDALQAELSSNPDWDWQRRKAGELIGPLQKGKSGTWREMFTARDRAIFHKIAGDTLAAWDYEATIDER